jgi:hypothetical protein
MFRAQDLRTTRSLHKAGARPPAGGGLEGAGTHSDPTARIRRLNRCQICGRLMPDERVFCSYCVQYVH